MSDNTYIELDASYNITKNNKVYSKVKCVTCDKIFMKFNKSKHAKSKEHQLNIEKKSQSNIEPNSQLVGADEAAKLTIQFC